MKTQDSLGDRMKTCYEDRSRAYLVRRMPVIVRIDGRAFHSLLLSKPFDYQFMDLMVRTASKVSEEMQGFQCGYIQSDEASFFLKDYGKLTSEAWFDYNQQKLCSVAASAMTAAYIQIVNSSEWFDRNRFLYPNKMINFDARAFNIPREDVINYFLWRAKDWERNSVSMYCRSFFSHKEMNGQGRADQHEMLHSIGKNWAIDLSPQAKCGTFFNKVGVQECTIMPTYEAISQFINPLLDEEEVSLDNHI